METSTTVCYESPVGSLLISGSDYCITGIHFCDDDRRPLPPAPEILPAAIISCIDQLMEYFAGRRRTFQLPAVPKGTAFQEKVWNELLAIPYGKTISYLEQSVRVG